MLAKIVNENAGLLDKHSAHDPIGPQASPLCDQKEVYSQTLLPGEVSTFTTSSITALLISCKKCEAQA